MKCKQHKETHLVGPVVVLRVICKDLGLLDVVKGFDQIIGSEFLSPFLTLDKPVRFRSLDVSKQRLKKKSVKHT